MYLSYMSRLKTRKTVNFLMVGDIQLENKRYQQEKQKKVHYRARAHFEFRGHSPMADGKK